MKTRAAAILACSAALLLTLCACSAGPAENSSQAQPQSLQSKDGKHLITIPGQWKDEGDGLNPNAVLAASNRNEEQYFIALQDNRENLNVLFPDFTLEKYSQYIAQAMSEKMSEPTVGETASFAISEEREAYITQFNGVLKDVDITYWVACTQVDDYFIQLICWTSTDRVEGTKPLVEELLSSYRFYVDGKEEISTPQVKPVDLGAGK